MPYMTFRPKLNFSNSCSNKYCKYIVIIFKLYNVVINYLEGTGINGNTYHSTGRNIRKWIWSNPNIISKADATLFTVDYDKVSSDTGLKMTVSTIFSIHADSDGEKICGRW